MNKTIVIFVCLILSVGYTNVYSEVSMQKQKYKIGKGNINVHVPKDWALLPESKSDFLKFSFLQENNPYGNFKLLVSVYSYPQELTPENFDKYFQETWIDECKKEPICTLKATGNSTINGQKFKWIEFLYDKETYRSVYLTFR